MPGWTERLAILSDEAAEDFAEALRICLPLGIRQYELRALPGGRLPYADEAAIQAVEDLVKEHGLKLIGMSPGFCKQPVDDPKSETEITQGVPDAFGVMERLGIHRMTVFSYRRTGDRDAPTPQRALENLERLAEACRAEGVEMLIENVSSCWGDTGRNVAEIAKAVGVRIVWDPANAEASGEPGYPDGYEHVKHIVAHTHFKDWLPDEGWVYIGDGQCDIAGQVAALKADEYPGAYCLEPHQFDDPEPAATENARRLLELLVRED